MLATEAAILIAEGNVDGGRRQYRMLADTVRKSDPQTAHLIMLYRAFSTLVLTGHFEDVEVANEAKGKSLSEGLLLRTLDRIIAKNRSELSVVP